MDGVTILQTTPAYSFPTYLSILIIIFGCAVIVVGAFALVFLFPFALAIGLVIFGAGLHSIDLPHPEQYKVTIDDSVSYNEFTDNYKIIETEGNVLTVEERKGE